VTDSVHWWRCIACMRPAMTRSLLMLSIAAAAMPSIGAQSRPAPRDSVTVDSLGRDSLAARLARAEAAIALLRQQVAIEAQTTVRTRSRLQLELSARIMTHAFLTTGRVNTVDVPQLAVIDLASGPPGLASAGSRALGMSVRQSRLGAAVTVDSVLGGVFEGDVELDFFGGLSTGSGDRRLFPEPRLRTARARVRWSRTSLFVGSETPLISDLNPISVASSGVPGFVAAGNLWNWIPQLRLSRDVLVRASGVRVGVQGAVLAPVSGVQFVNESDAVDGAERSGRPYLQGRVHVRWGDGAEQTGAPSDVLLGDGCGEIGLGVHRGWIRAAGDTASISSAISLDARVRVGKRVEFRGEAYRGQLVRGLGGGAVGQSFGRPVASETIGPPLRDVAGWLQVNVQAHPTLIAGAGCGRDKVTLADRPIRESNTACATHLLWRPAQPLILGLEARRIQTRYAGDTNRGNHVNLSFGFEL
jgi:hypothetical protein